MRQTCPKHDVFIDLVGFLWFLGVCFMCFMQIVCVFAYVFICVV